MPLLLQHQKYANLDRRKSEFTGDDWRVWTFRMTDDRSPGSKYYEADPLRLCNSFGKTQTHTHEQTERRDRQAIKGSFRSTMSKEGGGQRRRKGRGGMD